MEKSIKEMSQQEFEDEIKKCKKELKDNPDEMAKFRLVMLLSSRIHRIP